MCKAWADMQAECERRGELRGRVLEAFEILRGLPNMDDEKAIEAIMKKHNLSREKVESHIYGASKTS